MLHGSRAFLTYVVLPLAARISWRQLVAEVGTLENKKIHKHLHLWPLGPHRRRLAVRSETSKGSTVSRYACSTFGSNIKKKNVYVSSDENWPRNCHCMSCHHIEVNVMLRDVSSDENWPLMYHCFWVSNTSEWMQGPYWPDWCDGHAVDLLAMCLVRIVAGSSVILLS